MSAEEETAEQIARARSEEKIREARDTLLREQEEHRKTLAAEADKSRSELDIYMSDLSKGEQRQVRLHAYLTQMTADWADANNRQAGVDSIALRLARYMVTGEAK